MSEYKKSKAYRLFTFVLGVFAIVAFIAIAQVVSPSLPGTAGEVFIQNRDQDIEATALLYTEVVDVIEFLDTENGKYGFEISLF